MSMQDANNRPLLTHQEILRRDQILRDLRKLVSAHPKEARKAGRAIEAAIRADIEKTNEDKRQGVKDKLALLEVAKEIVLAPKKMKAPSDMTVDPASPPVGFEEAYAGHFAGKRVPRWVKRCYEAVGRYDPEIQVQIWNLVGHLEKAVQDGVKLRKTPAIDAYVHAVSKNLPQGKQSSQEVKNQLDPMKVVSLVATPCGGLVDLVLKILEIEHDKRFTDDEWWVIAILALMCVNPEFNSASVGIKIPLTWHDEEDFWGGRASILRWCDGLSSGSVDSRASESRVWLLAERALHHIKENPFFEEVTVTEAAELLMNEDPDLDLGRARARISEACTRGKIKTNGKKGANRRIDRDSLSAYLMKVREIYLNKWESVN